MAAAHSACWATMSRSVQIQCCLAAPSRRPRPQGQCRARPALRTFGQGRAGGLAPARSLERSSGGGEAVAQALDERNHPFEVGTVLWVWAALLLYRGIRAKEVPHRFKRGGQTLERACARAGIPRCTPNDLRRTYSTWLRADGVPNELSTPTMGHKDTRMLDRVYARLPLEMLRLRLLDALGRCSTGAVNTSGEGGLNGTTGQKVEDVHAGKVA